MLTYDEARPGAGGFQPPEDHGIVGDLWTGPLVEMDDSTDWSCCPVFDSPSSALPLLDRSIREAPGMLHTPQFDDDGVLDGWLASLTPDDFERMFDRLAYLTDVQHSDVEQTA